MAERKTRREAVTDAAIRRIVAEKGYCSIGDLLMLREAVASTELSHAPGYYDQPADQDEE